MKPIFEMEDIIDEKYKVTGLCSDAGGMGTILFVKPLKTELPHQIVLKYCKANDDEQLSRFRREVRVLASFQGNSKVVQIVDQNLDHDPPYFVMRYYPDGDLSRVAPTLRDSYAVQEKCFLQMVDCLQELHACQVLHRDIKPQNFLIDGSEVLVSDLGLTTEIGSATRFTRSSAWWGTHGYIPPEFLDGGFKYADVAGDIFMVGKTMYALLTGRDPMYIVSDNIPSALLHVIERCCSVSKDHRYQSLSQLKQSLVTAYDVLLGRSGAFGRVKQLLSVIEDRLEHETKYHSDEVSSFIEELALLEAGDQIQICREMSLRVFSVLAQEPLASSLPTFLLIYEKLVEEREYSWSFAETIADNMRAVFDGVSAAPTQRAKALDLAIRAAHYMHRFTAMDTCRSMIMSIDQEELGFHVSPIILKHNDTFLTEIELSQCQNDAVRNALRNLKEQK